MIVVNLFAGPGSGKSTTCAGLFHKLKLAGVNCEMALEYAKDKVWEESYKILDDQIYVFGKQLHRIFRLKDKVDVVITDSPLPLSIYYDKSANPYFADLVMNQFNEFNNINYFIVRDDTYNSKGRMQTEQEAKEIDSEVSLILGHYNIKYTKVTKSEAVDKIFNDVMKLL